MNATEIRKQYELYMTQRAASKGEDIPPEDILTALTQEEQKGGRSDGAEEDSQ